METIDELKKWLNEIGNHYSALKELNQFTDYDGYIYSTYETVRKKIDELEKAKNFLQPDVSGNEAIQKENKKESEVAVCAQCNGLGRLGKVGLFLICNKCKGTGKAN